MLIVLDMKVVFVVGVDGAWRGASAGIGGPSRFDVAEGRQLPVGNVALEPLEPGLGALGVAVDRPGLARRRRVSRTPTATPTTRPAACRHSTRPATCRQRRRPGW